MSDLQDAGRMFETAGQAAAAGDLASADELLRDVARIQEAELGPSHPDLANTLNNLAIVAEKTGRFDDAETFYRRAVAIAAASLPVDDPMVAASRQNLEDFCLARGLPIESMPETATDVAAVHSTPAIEAAPPPPPVLDALQPALPAETPTDAGHHSAAPREVSRSLVMAALGVAAVVAVTFFVSRSPSPPETPAPAPALQSTPPPRAEPAPPARAEPARPDTPPAASRAPGAVSLVTVQLCRTFSTTGTNWACEPAVDPTASGPLVLYTRVKSPVDTVVVHRWYRGDTLRQSVRLSVRANPTEGYRTYSRQTVDAGSDWRVEVSSAEGALLHERRIAVR
jgi:hypothetical protein